MNDMPENSRSVIFSFIETDGCLTNIQKQLCVDFLNGDISTDEYTRLIFKESMNMLRQTALCYANR